MNAILPCSSSSSASTGPALAQQPSKQQIKMAAAAEEYADGRLNLRLERFNGMQLEQKCGTTSTIARFTWELGALKHNILGEDNIPKAHLIIFVQCNEHSKRLDGWSCTAKIKLNLESEHKYKVCSLPVEQVRFPMQQSPGTMGLQLPWDKLVTEFQLNNEDDWLGICAKISIVEQFGYGTLIQLNTRLTVHGNVLLVNKFHLAAQSTYFQAFFFSEWTNKDSGGPSTAEYELSDPDDDVDTLQLVFAMTYPGENHPHPTDAKIGEVLRLADKYDLPIVSERCEKYLMATEGEQQERERPLIRKLALAERYGLYNLKSHCLERITPAHFCLELSENIGVYRELSEGLRAELEERLMKRSSDELYSQQQQREMQQQEGALPPPHKRVRPRPKTPPRPNYNLPPFRFK